MRRFVQKTKKEYMRRYAWEYNLYHWIIDSGIKLMHWTLASIKPYDQTGLNWKTIKWPFCTKK
jgi:hypothetical protein